MHERTADYHSALPPTAATPPEILRVFLIPLIIVVAISLLFLTIDDDKTIPSYCCWQQ